MNKLKLLAFTALLTVGCTQQKPTPPQVEVSGQVSYAGTPLTHGRIVFALATGHAMASDIDSLGKFQIKAYEGLNSISIVCREPDQPNPRGSIPATIPGKSLIPEKYAEMSTSGLTHEVSADKNQRDFDLR